MICHAVIIQNNYKTTQLWFLYQKEIHTKLFFTVALGRPQYRY